MGLQPYSLRWVMSNINLNCWWARKTSDIECMESSAPWWVNVGVVMSHSFYWGMQWKESTDCVTRCALSNNYFRGMILAKQNISKTKANVTIWGKLPCSANLTMLSIYTIWSGGCVYVLCRNVGRFLCTSGFPGVCSAWDTSAGVLPSYPQLLYMYTL